MQHKQWRIKHYEGRTTNPQRTEPDLFVLSAPSTQPDTRPNTPDTFAFLAKLLPEEARDVLVVTCSIFRYQDLDAKRILTLSRGTNVETIGFDTRQTHYHHPQHYLQEINSLLNSAASFYQGFHSPRTPYFGS